MAARKLSYLSIVNCCRALSKAAVPSPTPWIVGEKNPEHAFGLSRAIAQAAVEHLLPQPRRAIADPAPPHPRATRFTAASRGGSSARRVVGVDPETILV